MSNEADKKNAFLTSDTSTEPLKRDLISLKNRLLSNETDEKLKAIIQKAKECSESDEAEYVFGVFYGSIVEYETDIDRLRTEIDRLRTEIDKFRSIRGKARVKEAETLSIIRDDVLAVLDSSGQRNLRKRIEGVFRKHMNGGEDVTELGTVNADAEVSGSVMTWSEVVGRLLAAVCGGGGLR